MHTHTYAHTHMYTHTYAHTHLHTTDVHTHALNAFTMHALLVGLTGVNSMGK